MTNVDRYLSGFRIKNIDYIDQIVIAFLKVFPDYEILTRGKEREAAGRLAKIYKQKYPNAKTEEAIHGFELYFEACKNVDDNWLRDNMSLPIIMSKFNIINRAIMIKRNKANISSKYLNQGIKQKSINE